MENIEDYLITDTLNDSQIDTLIRYSNTDPVLAKWTSDRKRFSTQNSTKNWLQLNPEYIVLTDIHEELLGIAWLQTKSIPADFILKLDSESEKKFTKTCAIRLYSTVRGKGLGVWFYTQLFDRFESQYVWAKVSADNIASIHLHERLGFKQTSQPDDLNKIILVRDSHNN